VFAIQNIKNKYKIVNWKVMIEHYDHSRDFAYTDAQATSPSLAHILK
jgi:hypothetical protein